MQKFGIVSRTRPSAMGGIPPINPCDVLTLCEKLRWPCTFDEAVTVLLGMDDEYRQMHAKTE